MARFNCKLAALDARAAAVPHVAAWALGALALEDDAGSPCGPGWFDSSWDLESGLDVREGLPGDARVSEWLTLCLHA